MKRYRLTRLGKIVVFSFSALLILLSLSIYNMMIKDVDAIADQDARTDLTENGITDNKPEVPKPNTAGELIVYAAGQPPVNPENLETVKKLRPVIFFQPDSKVLKSEYNELLDMFAQISAVASDYKIKVEGNCATLYKNPNKELEQYYNSLSIDRAAEVAEVLKKKGIAPDRIIAVGNGATKPAKSNDTPDGRAYNRRVDIYFIEAGQN